MTQPEYSREEIEAAIADLEARRQGVINVAKAIDPTGVHAGAHTANLDEPLERLRVYLKNTYGVE